MNNKLLVLSILFFLATAIFTPGCAKLFNIEATILLPNGEEAVYRGPKKAEMTLKEKDREVKYSGKSESIWDAIMKIWFLTPSKK